MRRSFKQQFGRDAQVIAEAPGRIEFIGNHTDYNGGLVMGVAVDHRVRLEAATRDDHVLRMASAQVESNVSVELGNLVPLRGPSNWANYILGVIKVLLEHGVPVGQGLDIFVDSDLPAGAGLSSSAALELATACAVTKLFRHPLDRATLARLGRKAENTFVGVPCGILDQGVSAFGAPERIVRIDCATEAYSTLPMPKGLRFWIFNTLEKHSLVESLYATRNRECHSAFDLLKAQGAQAPNLASVDPGFIRGAQLPETLRKRALHVAEEHRRVQAMTDALEAGDLARIGDLLYASHASSRELFENSTPQLDTLVDILGDMRGVIGARLTGGGFGGAAMALCNADFGEDEAQSVVTAFLERFPHHPPSVFSARAGQGARVVEGGK